MAAMVAPSILPKGGGGGGLCGGRG